MRLLDTDILVDVLRGFAPAVRWLAGFNEAPGVPGFAALELLQGCRNEKEAQNVESLLKPLVIVWPSAAQCEQTREQFPRWYLSGGVGVLDALIAACAVELQATLHTFNVRHYRTIEGLSIETPPYRDLSA